MSPQRKSPGPGCNPTGAETLGGFRSVDSPKNANDRSIQKAVDRGQKRGCVICHGLLGNSELAVVANNRRRHVVVCVDCVTELSETSTIVGVTEFPTHPRSPWIMDDYKYFKRHPSHKYRLREPIGREVRSSLGSARLPFPEDAEIAMFIMRWESGGFAQNVAALPPGTSLQGWTQAGLERLAREFGLLDEIPSFAAAEALGEATDAERRYRNQRTVDLLARGSP
jgi:hypothetical protein